MKESVKDFVRGRLDLHGKYKWEYKCQYVFSWGSRIEDLRERLQEQGIVLTYLNDIIQTVIPMAIQQWKEDQVSSGIVRSKAKDIILPRKYRLLSVIDYTNSR